MSTYHREWDLHLYHHHNRHQGHTAIVLSDIGYHGDIQIGPLYNCGLVEYTSCLHYQSEGQGHLDMNTRLPLHRHENIRLMLHNEQNGLGIEQKNAA